MNRTVSLQFRDVGMVIILNSKQHFYVFEVVLGT